MEEKISLMPTIAIHTASPFKDLFPIKESVLNEIAEDMKQNGFDFAHPIIIWAGHLLCKETRLDDFRIVDRDQIAGVEIIRFNSSLTTCQRSAELQ